MRHIAHTTVQGFSALEIVISCAVITLALAAAASAFFGAQSLTMSADFYTNGLHRLQEVREKYIMLEPAHFLNVVSSTLNSIVFDTYMESRAVIDITPCIKKISTTKIWNEEVNTHSVSSMIFITDPTYVKRYGESCSGPELFPALWEDYIQSTHLFSLSNATDIDVVNSHIFISQNSLDSTDTDIVIVDRDSMDVISELTIGSGIFALDAIRDVIFAATNSTSGQFVVIDVTHKNFPELVASVSLAGVDPYGSYPQARSIFYLDDRVYIGTKETAGPEFHVFDVSNPQNPQQLGYLELTHNINDIIVRGSVAYLATSSDSEELIVVDVTNPAAMSEIGFFNTGSSLFNDRDAMSLYLLGNNLFLGRKRGTITNNELYMIDVTNPNTPTFIASLHLIFPGTSAYVSSVQASGDLIFVSVADSNKSFFVVDISNLQNIHVLDHETVVADISAFDLAYGEVYGIDPLGMVHVFKSALP